MTAQVSWPSSSTKASCPGLYLDVKQVWTFGIGHTAAGRAARSGHRLRDMPADIDAGIREAFRVFRADLARYEAAVRRAMKVTFEKHELDAPVTFHYNTAGMAKAALTRHLNAGERVAAAAVFMGSLKPVTIRPGRQAEHDLFALSRYLPRPSSFGLWTAMAGSVSRDRSAACPRTRRRCCCAPAVRMHRKFNFSVTSGSLADWCNSPSCNLSLARVFAICSFNSAFRSSAASEMF